MLSPLSIAGTFEDPHVWIIGRTDGQIVDQYILPGLPTYTCCVRASERACQ